MKKSTPTVTVGLDVGEQFIHLCEMDATSGVIETAKFRNGRHHVRKRFEGVERCRIVLEAGSHSRWLAEDLTEMGHEVLVVNPRKLKLVSDSLYKDDTLDAERLADLGQSVPHLLGVVRVRSEQHHRALVLVRARAKAVKCRTLTINAIRGLLKPFGIRIRKDGRASTFITYCRNELPADLAPLIEPLLATLEALNQAIKDYERQVEPMLEKLAPEAVHLTAIHGVGALTALYFVALVGDPHRFSKTRSIGSFLGLVRGRKDSGKKKSEQHITKAGDPYMRALLGNAASHIVGPFGADNDLRRWALARPDQTAGHRRITKTALARKLAVLMLTLWKTGDAYAPLHNAARQPVEVAA